MNINSKCYRFDYIQFGNGLLDNIIDAVYVILLENSDRTEDVYKQINDYKLSKNTYIQINKGYKNCDKKLVKQQSNFDLVDCNYNIWLHANKNNYNNILILEDDFEFDNRILDKNVLQDLDDFINNNDFDIYSLGSRPILLSLPITNIKHIRLSHQSASQSIIITKNTRSTLIDKYINDKQFLIKNYGDIDREYNNYRFYSYYKPLCYQIFPETENQKNWYNGKNILDKIMIYININFIVKIFNLHHTSQPGWDYLYILFYMFNITFYLIILYVIFCIVYPKYFRNAF